MINPESDIVLLQQEPVKSAAVENLDSVLLIGRHESVIQTLPDFPHRQFLVQLACGSRTFQIAESCDSRATKDTKALYRQIQGYGKPGEQFR